MKNYPAVYLPGAICLLKEQPVSWATSQLVKKLSAFSVFQIWITVSTSAIQNSVMSQIHKFHPHHVYFFKIYRHIILHLGLSLSSRFFLHDFRSELRMPATCPTQLILLNLNILTIYDNKDKTRRSLNNFLHSIVASSFLYPNLEGVTGRSRYITFT